MKMKDLRKSNLKQYQNMLTLCASMGITADDNTVVSDIQALYKIWEATQGLEHVNIKNSGSFDISGKRLTIAENIANKANEILSSSKKSADEQQKQTKVSTAESIANFANQILARKR
ncbi:hypothetical protein [Desulfosporosinus sp. SB140]|uniref:hypothetical protein n=1 Tax=Desulfosporosinus paludis TaxID=3115649 RepID=UPI00388D07A9